MRRTPEGRPKATSGPTSPKAGRQRRRITKKGRASRPDERPARQLVPMMEGIGTAAMLCNLCVPSAHRMTDKAGRPCWREKSGPVDASPAPHPARRSCKTQPACIMPDMQNGYPELECRSVPLHGRRAGDGDAWSPSFIEPESSAGARRQHVREARSSRSAIGGQAP